ncbi:MAG: DUF6498-containing protein [Actinobacteria bacterium]|nr:DUF6498-containing protein [Actinomycetota bacterium]
MPDAPSAPPAGTTLTRALPGILLIAAASLAPLWGVVAEEWSVLAVAFVYVADGVADGLTFWLRARRAQGAASDEAAKDRVLVSEFVRTYFVVVAAMALVLYMVFSGRLLRPAGGVPDGVFRPFATWQFWAVVAGLVAVRWFVYWWDWVRGGEADFMPPAGVVAAPLRRLFVLQFGVLVGGLIVYWPLDSSSAALVVLVVLVAAAEVALAVLERLRTARIRAAAEAGVKAETRGGPPGGPAAGPAKTRPRGGRRRARRR